REAYEVYADVLDQFITREVAEQVYGLVFDPVTDEVDYDRTEENRKAIRRQRIEQGKNIDEFIVEWLQKKPREDILIDYGHWPEPRVENYKKEFWGLYD